MKYKHDKGILFSNKEKALIIVLVAVLIVFGLVLTNNRFGVSLTQTIIAGLE